jgi:hypothetical protein
MDRPDKRAASAADHSETNFSAHKGEGLNQVAAPGLFIRSVKVGIELGVAVFIVAAVFQVNGRLEKRSCWPYPQAAA